MKSSNVWLLNIAAASAIAILVLLTYLCLDQVRSTEWFSERVEHTYKTINESERLFSQVKEAEAGIRGYLLTSNELFIKSYKQGRTEYEASAQRLQFLLNDNAHQLRRLAVFKSLARDKWESMDLQLKGIDKIQNQDSMILKSKAIMDAMQKQINEIQDEERKLLTSRLKAREREFNLAPTYLLTLALLAGGLLIISATLLNIELRRRRLIQIDLEKKVEALNRSNAELEQFAYVASHDLQEPLRKIRAFADRLLMRQRDQLTEDGQTMLDKIANAAERMQSLINDLLTFSRMVSRTDPLQMVNLNEVLDEVQLDLSEVITEQQASVHVQALPTIQGYPSQVRQLLLNLLSNALKFTKPDVLPMVEVTYRKVDGSEIPTLDSDLKKEQWYHCIRISDNGIGFEPEYAEKIFVIFQRLHAKSAYGGTGIGLAICRRVVTNHEGYIFAEGKPGQGALFTIYLPIETTQQNLTGTTE
ncbi:sensor histidine kinase [Siphonobacter curvatus]|uniref:histidine kinase n=1 Tax=Siphonobacter curvatus TaxID=2094562 RepID=A0A2S7IJ06_9BACT|nr:sensor histidine kinase [Siphonobacter curvatus]PQA56243.1 histidine kinase [Siphonobacter curvatus]